MEKEDRDNNFEMICPIRYFELRPLLDKAKITEYTHINLQKVRYFSKYRNTLVELLSE